MNLKIFMKINKNCSKNLSISQRGIFSALRYWLMIVLSVTWLTACETSSKNTAPRALLIYVTSNGWHTSIIVPASPLITFAAIPETDDFLKASFFEFGWGDRAYYQAKKATFNITLRAGLAPTPSVIHMTALKSPPKEKKNSQLEVISLKLTKTGFQHLAQALAEEFKRPHDGGRAKSISRGLYPNSYFYHARGKFHLFNTCNTWTARMLYAGGVDLSPSGIITAHGLMIRLREALDLEKFYK